MSELIPLTFAEMETLRLQIEKGEVLPLETLKRIVLTRRKSFSAIPTEKRSKDRTTKAAPSEDQLDFF